MMQIRTSFHIARAALLLALLALLALAACTDSTAVALKEQARVAAPGGKVDAVLAEMATDATVGHAYEIHLVPAGSTRFATASLRADKAAGISLHWRDAHTLLIRCEAARIFAFSNFWQSAEVDNYTYTVALELDGCRYPAAAPDKDKS